MCMYGGAWVCEHVCVCMCVTHKRSRRKENDGAVVIVFNLLYSCRRGRETMFFPNDSRCCNILSE